jgi:hypothetical protein
VNSPAWERAVLKVISNLSRLFKNGSHIVSVESEYHSEIDELFVLSGVDWNFVRLRASSGEIEEREAESDARYSRWC